MGDTPENNLGGAPPLKKRGRPQTILWGGAPQLDLHVDTYLDSMAQTIWQILIIEKKLQKIFGGGGAKIKLEGGAPQLSLQVGTSLDPMAQTVWQILRIEIKVKI